MEGEKNRKVVYEGFCDRGTFQENTGSRLIPLEEIKNLPCCRRSREVEGEWSLREIGICFIDERLIQNDWESILSLRQGLGIRTLFNLLDPILNPAGAEYQVLGVYAPELTEKMAWVLKNLGIQRGLVIYGEGTLDEMSITGKMKITEILREGVKSYFIDPEDVGIKRRSLEEIRGGTREENAETIINILKGCKGAKREITLLNAASAFFVSGRVRSLQEGMKRAEESIESGAALEKLETLIEFNRRERPFLREFPGKGVKSELSRGCS